MVVVIIVVVIVVIMDHDLDYFQIVIISIVLIELIVDYTHCPLLQLGSRYPIPVRFATSVAPVTSDVFTHDHILTHMQTSRHSA